MGRKKYNKEDKKATVSLSINPQLAKMLDEQSEKEGLSKSALIENVLEDKLDKDNIDNLIKELEIILNSIVMNKNRITDSRIKFIKAAINMNLQ